MYIINFLFIKSYIHLHILQTDKANDKVIYRVSKWINYTID